MARWPAIRCAFGCLLVLFAGGCERGYHLWYGLIDASGEWSAEPVYAELEPLSEGLSAAARHGRWGFIDAEGDWVIEPRYASAGGFSEGLAAVLVDSAWQYVDRDGGVAIAGPFDQARPFLGGLAPVKTGTGWGFIDHAGRFVIAAQFEALVGDDELAEIGRPEDWFDEGLCAARAHAGWGYIDRAGRWVIEPGLAAAGPFREGLAAVREATPDETGRFGYIDRRGRWVIEPRFEAAAGFSGGRSVVVRARTTGEPGDEQAPPDAGEAATAGSAAAAESVDAGIALEAVLIDAAGREIVVLGWQPLAEILEEAVAALGIAFPDYLEEGLVPATREGKWGFVNRSGEWVIEPEFGLVMPFSHGVAAAAAAGVGGDDMPLAGGGWGLIDTSGRWVVQPTLEALRTYGVPDAEVRRSGRWGLLDRDGAWTLPPRLAHLPGFLDFEVPGLVSAFSEGLLVGSVFANHRWTLVDGRGRKRDVGTLEWLDRAGPDQSDEPALNVTLDQALWGLTDRRLRELHPEELDAEPTPSDGFLKAVRHGRVGCLDARGEWVIPAVFDEVEHCGKGPVIAFLDGQTGVWAPGAGWILAPGDYASAVEPWPGTFAFESADGWRLYRQAARGGPAGPLPGGPYDSLEVTVAGAVPVSRAGRIGFLAADAPVAEEFPYDEVDDHYIGQSASGARWVVAVRRGELWGTVDAQGREQLPVRFDEIGRGHEDLLAVRTGETWRIVDLRGREVFAPRAGELRPVGRRIAAFRGGGAWGLVSREGKVLVEPKYGEIRAEEGGLRVWLGGGPQPDNTGKTGLVGILDARGRTLVEPRFQELESFAERYWLVKDEAGWSLLARGSGRHVRDLPGVVRVEARSEGRAAARYDVAGPDGGAYGYLDERGAAVIAPGFDEAGPFRNGIAVVKRGGKCGVIDRDGRELLPIEYEHCNRLADGRVAAAVEAPFEREKWKRALEAARATVTQ